MTPPPRFFFVHLQKTAGTALFQRLVDAVGREAVYPLPADQGTPEAVLDVDLLRRRFDAHRDELRVITGHFPLCVTELLGVPFTTFTLLRDPVERTLSFLRHRREVEPGDAALTLDEVYDRADVRRALVDDHMTKMLSVTTEELATGATTPIELGHQHLVRAQHHLEHRIDLFGLQEHFDDFCEELGDRFGLDLGRPRFANRTQPAAEPDGLRERIVADNPLDIELYRFASDLWEHRHPTVDPLRSDPATR